MTSDFKRLLEQLLLIRKTHTHTLYMKKKKCSSKWIAKVAITWKRRVRSVQLWPYQSRETWKMWAGHEMMDDVGRREHKEDHLLPFGFSENRCWDVWGLRCVLGKNVCERKVGQAGLGRERSRTLTWADKASANQQEV